MNEGSALTRAWAALVKRGPARLSRFAAVAALVGLLMMTLSIVVPSPLIVILAMSAGHVVGAVALLSYFVAVVLEVRRHEREKGARPHPANESDSPP